MNLNEARNILGVEVNASEEDIKKAYRILAMKWHPDKHGEQKKKKASEKFTKISEAYDVLTNPEKATQNNFNFQSQKRYWQSRSKRYNPIQNGEDVFCDLSVTLEEAVQGTTKKVNIQKPVVCDLCHGTGLKSGKQRTECSSCKGGGYVSIRQRIMGTEFYGRHTCPTCQGIGSIIENQNACEQCKTKKTIKKETSVDVQIPSGVRDGVKLGANSLGGEGIAGGNNGRLFVNVQVEEHEHYKIIEGTNDLRLDYNISYYDHYFGGSFQLKTIYGDTIIVKIPEKHNLIDPIIKLGYGLPGMPNKPMRNTMKEKGSLKIYLNVKAPDSLDFEENVIKKLNYKVDNPVDYYQKDNVSN